jgi:hypothetical protein
MQKEFTKVLELCIVSPKDSPMTSPSFSFHLCWWLKHIFQYKSVAYIWLECIFQYKNMELKVGTHPLSRENWVSLQRTLVCTSKLVMWDSGLLAWYPGEPVGWAADYGHKEPYSSIHIGVHQLSKGYLMQWVQVCSNMTWWVSQNHL